MNAIPTRQIDQSQTIPVGLSACLAGLPVRYNGGHSQSKLCLHSLSHYFDFRTFCPEMAAGFGTPRATLRLTGDPQNPNLSFSKAPQTDVSQQLCAGFAEKMPQFAHLDGYILMKNSPSCGLERIKVYQANGHPHPQRSQGLFTRALQHHYPQLPLEEEGRLHDGHLRENFILRVYVHHNFRREVLNNPSYHALLQFHSSYKYVVMAHSQSMYRHLGRKLAQSRQRDLHELINEYLTELMQALNTPATRTGHSNVLLHMLGYLKKSVPGTARQAIVDVVHRYRLGQIPLITPLTLLQHYIEQQGSAYIQGQRYLQPYPDELGLRNQL